MPLSIDRGALKRALASSPFGGRITAAQWRGVETLLDAFDEYGDGDLRKLANVLAQCFHETGRTMRPVRETFAKSDAAAIAALDRAWAAGRLKSVKIPYWRDGWFGRGYIQLTHRRNYERMGKRLGIDLVDEPGRALVPDVSARIAVVGMMEGLFTGKKLANYFSATRDDPKGARAIVNGSDRAALIAGYHAEFLAAIQSASTEAPAAPLHGKGARPHSIDDPDTVLRVQRDLRALGYFQVGAVDGELGDLTKDAILAFRRRERLPLRDTIDDEFLAALAKAKPRELSPARTEAPIEVVAERAPAVKPTLRTRLIGLWGTITGAIGTAVAAIGDWFEDVWDKLEPVREVLESVPSWAWFGLAAGICLVVYLNSRSAVEEAKTAYRQGRVM